jgi:hypothetical protein
MSYRNPSKITSNSSNSNGYSNAIAIALREDEIQEARTKANISSLVQGSLDAVLAKQDGLNNLNKAVTKSDLNMYNRVESDGFKTGFNSFDKKAEDLMFNSITKFNKIKSSIENGTSDDLELSKQGLASIINSMIDQYGDAVPNILAVNEAINKQSSSAELDEQFSVTGAPAHQLAIISKLSQGSGDIDIIEENDNIILVDNNPGKWYNEDENGNLIEGKGPTRLNLFEFNRNLLNKNNPYLKYKADPTQVESSAWSELVKQESGYNPNYVTDEDGKYRMTVDQQKAFKDKVTGLANYKKNDKGFYTYLPGDNNNEYNGFSTLLRKRGESIWEDEGNMQTLVREKGLKSQWPKVIPQPGTKEFNEFVDGQYIPALKWLAEETLRKNSQDITLDQPGDNVSSNKNKTTGSKENKNKKSIWTKEDIDKWNKLAPGETLVVGGSTFRKEGKTEQNNVQSRLGNMMEREALNK